MTHRTSKNRSNWRGIKLQAGASVIKDAANQHDPSDNEIDRRYVLKAGAVDRRFDDLQVLVDQRTGELLGRVQRMYQAFSEGQWEHNRALFTPGLLRSVGEEMRVDPAGGLTVEVRPGAALDSLGRRLLLGAPERVPITPVAKPTIIYIYAAYEDHFGAYLNDPKPDTWDSNVSGTPFSDFSTARLGCTERLQVDWLELARIDLAPDATEIRRPVDPARPGRIPDRPLCIKYAETQPTLNTTSTTPNTAVQPGSARTPRSSVYPRSRTISRASSWPASPSNPA